MGQFFCAPMYVSRPTAECWLMPTTLRWRSIYQSILTNYKAQLVQLESIIHQSTLCHMIILRH